MKTPATRSPSSSGTYTADRFNLSSLMHTATTGQLKAACIQATLKPSMLIEAFDADWEKTWFTYRPEDWGRQTHKVYDERWKAPADAKLAFEVRSAMPNRLVVGIDEHAAEVHLAGHSEWERIVLTPGDFRDGAGAASLKWTGIKELRLGAKETLRSKINGKEQKLTFGANWEGAAPEFRNLRWITQ